MSNLQLTSQELEQVFSTELIRARSRLIYDRAIRGEGYFSIDHSKWSEAVSYLLQVLKKNYPDLKVPFHSRWRHFSVGGIDRATVLKEKLKNLEPMEQCRVQYDLVVTSVLLDAGAGTQWKYLEAGSGKTFSRSEGLGVASYDWFMSGGMSSDQAKLQADASGLESLTIQSLEKAFQVNSGNPLVGGEGRLLLLKNLATAVRDRSIFSSPRPGALVDRLVAKYGKKIPATGILQEVLLGFGPIWPGRLQSQGKNLGDVWTHSSLGRPGEFASLVPFHKLSQWLTYSLIEPLEWAGIEVYGVDQLTGLAEYRNGGFFVDAGVLKLKDQSLLAQAHNPKDELIVEWRALTVYLLDQIAVDVQKALGLNSTSFPLARVLEGGTWWAGRGLAEMKRPGATPPIQIASDGTVF